MGVIPPRARSRTLSFRHFKPNVCQHSVSCNAPHRTQAAIRLKATTSQSSSRSRRGTGIHPPADSLHSGNGYIDIAVSNGYAVGYPPRNPSRTTVDHYGNVWVANRDGNSVTKTGPNGGIYNYYNATFIIYIMRLDI